MLCFSLSYFIRFNAENEQHFQIINHESKLRLMMIVAAIYPKKFEGEKGRKMMEVINNIYLHKGLN